jgi:diguanylate cyclase (GGDEF)-like protein
MASFPRSVRALLAFAALLLAAQVLRAAGILPGPDWLYDDVLPTVVPLIAAAIAAVAASRRRRSILIAVGIAGWATANLLWTFALGRTSAFLALILFLPLYGMVLATVVLDVLERVPRLGRDGAIDLLGGMLAVAALGFGLMFPLAPHATATELAFPVLGVVGLALVVGAFAAVGWSRQPDWLAAVSGFAAMSAGDLLWAVDDDSSWPTSLCTTLWSLGLVAMALMPWLTDRRPVRHFAGLTWPFTLFLACVALLVAGDVTHVAPIALAFAVASVLVTTYRTVHTFRAMRQLPETRRQALTDELTGLTNRRSFLDATARQLSEHPFASAAVLMLDLDRFKELNDTMGHAAGDRLLAELGPRLSSGLRPGDTLARLGGDEFAVLCPGADPAGARRVARRLQDALEQPFAIGDLLIHVDASVGIAAYPRDGGSVEELLQRADVAMYQAKGGGTEVETYDASRDEHSRDKLALAGELRRALDRGDGLELHYQPQADLRTDRVLAVEALVRWRHPERGLLPPGVFLPVAESAGLMRRLGREVLRRAIAQAAAWQRSGAGVPVAVNLATADLVDGGLATEIAQLLDNHELDGSWLKLEITENTVMAQPERVTETLGQLRSLGCRVSLDDFGTGHASLEHLMRLPVDELKIDRSFVTGLDVDDAASLALVRALALLGRDLHLTVVAEGVETPRAWGHLVASGCAVAQGFLLARPLPAPELEAWLASRRSAWEEEAA